MKTYAITCICAFFLPLVSFSGSVDPAQAIRQAAVFSTPLEWVGNEPKQEDSSALLSIIQASENREAKALIAALDLYVVEHPKSSWSPYLRVNLAEYYRRHGRYSLALSHWEVAWAAVKSDPSPQAQKLAARTIAGWTRLLASIGEKEKVTALLAEFDKLQIPMGTYAPTINGTREGVLVMSHSPGASYRCGSFALGHMAIVFEKSKAVCDGLFQIQSPDGGFRLDELLLLSQTNQMECEAYRRPVGGEIVVPSVVHWKLNHYAAIVNKVGDLYQIKDPTFESDVYMDAEALDAEAGGEFLILKGRAPAGWQKLTPAEAAKVYGKGYPNVINDDDDNGPNDGCGGGDGNEDSSSDDCDPPTANDGSGNGGDEPPPPCCGMPQWSISEPYISLWLKDSPLLYRQSNGKWMQLKLSYKSRGEDLAGQQVGGFGDRWSCNWFGVLEMGSGPNVYINHLAGGGKRTFVKNGARDYKTGRLLLSAPTTGIQNAAAIPGIVLAPEIHTPTGSKNSYRYRVLNQSGGLNHLITERKDRYGRNLQQYRYDQPNNVARLVQVLDLDGKTNTLSYNNTNFPNLITCVTNPYGLVASFFMINSVG